MPPPYLYIHANTPSLTPQAAPWRGPGLLLEAVAELLCPVRDGAPPPQRHLRFCFLSSQNARLLPSVDARLDVLEQGRVEDARGGEPAQNSANRSEEKEGEETRLDPEGSGERFTKAEFIDFYGGTTEWVAAGPAVEQLLEEGGGWGGDKRVRVIPRYGGVGWG